jgi:hypothetical protein
MWQTILGAMLALLGGFVASHWQYRREADCLRAALAAELSAVQILISKRGYLDGLRAHIEWLKAGQRPGFFQVRISNNYDVVFKSNAQRIGTCRRR